MPLIKLSCHHYAIPFIIENYAMAEFSALVQNFNHKFCTKINGIFNQWNLKFYGSNKRSRIIQRNPT